MSNKTKTKKQISKTGLIIIVGLIIIAIPFVILGGILISASLSTGKPINGDRFKNDLDPAITSTNIKDIETKISSNSKVEEVNVELKTATLRVYVDTTDSLTSEDIEQLSKDVYQDVITVLDVQKYFTQTSDKQMYDLEVHVYNQNKDYDNNFVYAITNKNSAMSEAQTQLVSEARDPELAQQLRDDVEQRLNPTPTPDSSDVEVQGEDVEDTTQE